MANVLNAGALGGAVPALATPAPEVAVAGAVEGAEAAAADALAAPAPEVAIAGAGGSPARGVGVGGVSAGAVAAGASSGASTPVFSSAPAMAPTSVPLRMLVQCRTKQNSAGTCVLGLSPQMSRTHESPTH
eukprot:7568290-Alexandrium_andersonii.AAC.1